MVSKGRKVRKAYELRRRAAFKVPSKTVLIVCEGEKTEPLYFKSLKLKLKLSSVIIDICGKECGSAPISVVEYAIEKRDDAPVSSNRDSYDAIWCVFDTEDPRKNVTLANALSKAKTKRIHIALSNPCFEYWFVLHYKKTAPIVQNCDEMIKRLKKHYPAYTKGDNNIFVEIYPNTDNAIIRSKEILKEKCSEGDIKDCNPSTSVHCLVEYLKNLI